MSKHLCIIHQTCGDKPCPICAIPTGPVSAKELRDLPKKILAPSLPAVPDAKEEERVLPAFYCLKCRNTFREIGGKQYRDGDVAQWCPHCGASDDHIYELSAQEQAGMFIPPVLEEPGAVAANTVHGQMYRSLRSANIARQAEWCPEQVPDLSFRGNELAGETGEVCNVIKKLERARQGWRGSRDTKEHLAEELADVVICADLIGIAAGIDLDAAVALKFNATSEKVGLPHRLAPSVWTETKSPTGSEFSQSCFETGWINALNLQMALTALEHCRQRPHEHNPSREWLGPTRCEVIDRGIAAIQELLQYAQAASDGKEQGDMKP